MSHSRPSSPSYTSPLVTDTTPLIVPEAPVGTPASELLNGYVTHENQASSSTLVGGSAESCGHKKYTANDEQVSDDEFGAIEEAKAKRQELEEIMRRPFYKRPSPWWMLGMVLLSAIAMTTTIAPKVELYTALVCRIMKPEYSVESNVNHYWTTGATVPPPPQMCGEDPDVQAAVARLITVMTVFPGVLSCLTTGWWGQLSDRYGRMWVLGIATTGLLATDFNFILVSRAADRLPGGYLFLLVGPVFDGLLGGMPTLMAGLHAYLSDCTPTEKRSRIFSLTTGLLFTGMALGPTLGSLFIRATNDLLSVFYVATASHIIGGFFIWFIIPESLLKCSMRIARKRRHNRRRANTVASLGSTEHGNASIMVWATRLTKNLFAFLAPLSIFVPYKRSEGRGRNWNLLLTVFSFTFYTMLMGSYQFKFQYAQRTFGWNSEVLGYWLSAVGVARATYLVLVLPLLIKIFKPKVTPIQLPVLPEESLHPSQTTAERDDDQSHSVQQPSRRNTAPFDLNLARVSLAVELICQAGMGLAMSPSTWMAASLLDSLASGYTPALQSVALALYEQGPNKGIETGRLFGGLGVAQSLSSQIIGPSLFGITYASTANSRPEGIFALGFGVVAVALLSISLVRLLQTPKARHDRDETAVAGEDR